MIVYVSMRMGEDDISKANSAGARITIRPPKSPVFIIHIYYPFRLTSGTLTTHLFIDIRPVYQC